MQMMKILIAIKSLESFAHTWKNEDSIKRIIIVNKLASLLEENILVLVSLSFKKREKQ